MLRLLSILIPTAISFFMLELAWSQASPDVYLIKPSSGSVNLDSGRYEVKETPAPVKRKTTVDKPRVVNTQPELDKPVQRNDKVPPADEPKSVAKDDVVQPSSDDDQRSWTEVDPRFNVVQVSLTPGYLYLNSDSQSWFRNYYSSSPVVNAKAEFWMNRSISVSAGFMNSLAADMTADPSTSEKIEVDHRSYDLGVYFRKYGAKNRKASSLIAGLNYNEYQLIMDATEATRVRIKTKGVGLYLGARIPISTKKAMVLSTTLRPKLSILEGGTQSSYQSGDLDTASSYSLGIKYEHLLNRKNIFYWELEHQVDKSIYKGSTNIADPITGSTIDGVSVTSGKSLLNFGVTWGD